MDTTQLLIIIIPSILSFLGGYLLFRLKGSLIQLQKKITVQRIASSYNDAFWGNIDILYNEQKIDHLHSITIELSNNERKDVDDLILSIVSPPETKILSSYAMNMDTRVELDNSTVFQQQVAIANWDYLNQNRQYQANVLNRGTQLTVNLLIESINDDLSNEEFVVSVEKKGIVIKPYKSETSDLGFILTGLIIALLTAFGTYLAYPEALIPIAIVAIVGSLNIWIGMVIYYTIKGWKHWDDDDDE